MPVPVYMVIGCPGSGKSWVCRQLTEQYYYVPHDDHMGKNSNRYIAAIVSASKIAAKPLLIETPFSVSQIKEPLEAHDYHVTPVFILEQPEVISQRYLGREGHPIPAGHLSRQQTYRERADKWQSYRGTSAEVLAYLKNAVPAVRKWPWE